MPTLTANLRCASKDPTDIELKQSIILAPSAPIFREVPGRRNVSPGSGGSEMPPDKLSKLPLYLRLTFLTEGVIHLS